MTGPDTFYICNRKKACNTSKLCGTLCTHTSDEAFAKNAPEDRIFDTRAFNADDTYELIEKAWEVEK